MLRSEARARWAAGRGLACEWVAENTGVAPDVEVELDPKAVAAGHDPQLERVVSAALEQLQKNPPPKPHQPPYPD